MVMRSRTKASARCSRRISSAQASNSSARTTSGAQIEAEGELDLPCSLSLARVALAIGTIAANDQAGVDERRYRWRLSVAGAMPWP